jgi:hypothetical protein
MKQRSRRHDGKLFWSEFSALIYSVLFMCTIAWPIQARSSLELKTWPRFRPICLNLSMVYPYKGTVLQNFYGRN